MSDAFEDLLSELETAGVTAEHLERLRQATAASPLRKELRELKETHAKVLEETRADRQALMERTFREAGVGVAPGLLSLPPDLDFRSVEAVRKWGQEVGLVAAPPPPPATPQSEQDAAAAIARTGNASQAPDPDADRMAALQAVRNAPVKMGQAPDLRALVEFLRSQEGWSDSRGR